MESGFEDFSVRTGPTDRHGGVELGSVTPGLPRFVELYPTDGPWDDDDHDPLVFSPRIAAAAWTAASQIVLRFERNVPAKRRELLSMLVPDPAVPFLTDEFGQRFVQSVETFRNALAVGIPKGDTPVTCTGDEVAILSVLLVAEMLNEDGRVIVDLEPTWLDNAYPDHFADHVAAGLIRHHGFHSLWDVDDFAQLDQVAERLDIANYHPHQWFLPFA